MSDQTWTDSLCDRDIITMAGLAFLVQIKDDLRLGNNQGGWNIYAVKKYLHFKHKNVQENTTLVFLLEKQEDVNAFHLY